MAIGQWRSALKALAKGARLDPKNLAIVCLRHATATSLSCRIMIIDITNCPFLLLCLVVAYFTTVHTMQSSEIVGKYGFV